MQRDNFQVLNAEQYLSTHHSLTTVDSVWSLMPELSSPTPTPGTSPLTLKPQRLARHTSTPLHAAAHHWPTLLLTGVRGPLTRHATHWTWASYHCLLLRGNTSSPSHPKGGASSCCVTTTSGCLGTSLYRLTLSLSCQWSSLSFRGAPYNWLYLWLT